MKESVLYFSAAPAQFHQGLVGFFLSVPVMMIDKALEMIIKDLTLIGNK